MLLSLGCGPGLGFTVFGLPAYLPASWCRYSLLMLTHFIPSILYFLPIFIYFYASYFTTRTAFLAFDNLCHTYFSIQVRGLNSRFIALFVLFSSIH